MERNAVRVAHLRPNAEVILARALSREELVDKVIVKGTASDIPCLSRVGGKAHNLAHLMRAGARVPAWYVVTTELMKRVLGDVQLDQLAELGADQSPEKIESVLVPIRRQIEAISIPEDLVGQLRLVHERTIGKRLFSVRSSAVDEDSAGASFAGLHDSFLFINDFDGLLDAVRKVWASAYTTRAITFRLQNGLDTQGISIAVIVQHMVEATVSGIMFTANPNTGNVHELLISSCYGAGEGIVSAGLDADLFTVVKASGEVQQTLVSKREQLLFDRESGVGLKRVDVPTDLQEGASLSASQVAAIAELGKKIEAYYGKPQDIELSIDAGGAVHILQARPITTLPEYGPAAGNRIVWDNSNIIESYSGPTSPMTFSFIRHAYTIVYHCFSQVMGIPPEDVHRNRHVFENMLGLINGQVYYNIKNWYLLVRLFPGFNYNKAFMESMMGLSEKLDIEEDEPVESTFYHRYFVELPKLIRLLFRSLSNFRKIDKLVVEFENHFASHYRTWAAMDFDAMAPHELMLVYREMEEKLLWSWKTPIINDFYVMIFYGLLKNRCTVWCGDESGSLQNDLICGQGDIESTRPTKLLMEIARTVRNDPQLLGTFMQRTCNELRELVPDDPSCKAVAEKIDFYLEHYGFRCINELKLEEPSLRETPDFLYQMVQNYLKLDDESALDPQVMDDREAEIRAKASEKAFAAIAGKGGLLPKKRMFRWILRNARKGVRNRENMRFARTKIYGMLRELLNAIGRRLECEGILDDWNDIYYLTIDEVWDFIKGTAVTRNLRGLAALRKREFAEYDAPDAPSIDDHFETFGMVYHRNLFRNWKSQTEATEDDLLKGIGCCPGKVTARVRIVHSPKDDLKLDGEILVAGRTDPGWVPLYPAVSGILIERGSILSHSAIVAREMGLPTIVGIPKLLATLKDGQTVTMDGTTGVVDLLEDA
jgi:pyruvate,water dikinase